MKKFFAALFLTLILITSTFSIALADEPTLGCPAVVFTGEKFGAVATTDCLLYTASLGFTDDDGVFQTAQVFPGDEVVVEGYFRMKMSEAEFYFDPLRQDLQVWGSVLFQSATGEWPISPFVATLPPGGWGWTFITPEFTRVTKVVVQEIQVASYKNPIIHERLVEFTETGRDKCVSVLIDNALTTISWNAKNPACNRNRGLVWVHYTAPPVMYEVEIYLPIVVR